MNTQHRKTLIAIFTKPTRANIRFSDVERLILALGGEKTEGNGSRMKFFLKGFEWHGHKLHPGKEAKRYQIETLREFLVNAGVFNDE